MTRLDHERTVRLAAEYGIPEHMRYPLALYIHDHIPPGSFLTAVLSNDLFGAFARADDINKQHIGNFVTFLYNQVPLTCHGSPEAVEQWLSGGEPCP